MFDSPGGDSSSRRGETVLFVILALALALRLGHWLAVRDAPFVADLIVDSKEYDAWARQVASGDWLGSQVFFQAPLYPYLLAGIYSIFGRSLDVVYLLQIVFAVAGIWAIFHAGRLMGGERIGIAAAGLSAIYGPYVFYDVQVLKESLAVTAMSFLLWATARARNLNRPAPWMQAGALLGALVLLRENALFLTPILLALALQRGDAWRPTLLRFGAALVGLALPLTPLAIRNGAIGGGFLPTTSAAGVSFFIGNNPNADGTYLPVVPGKQIPSLERQESVRVAEAAVGHRLTPRQVSSYWFRTGLSWATAHPLDFTLLQGKKLGMYWSWYEWPDAVDYYWIRQQSAVYGFPFVEFSTISLLSIGGLWILWRRRLLRAFAPAWAFAGAWMFSTIIFFLFSRYRLPGLPPLVILSALPIVAVLDAKRAGNRSWRLGAGLAAAALFLSLVPAGRPRIDLVEFNLGRLAQEKGDSRSAEAHYVAALAENPKTFLACLNIGTMAARNRDWPKALFYFERAESLEPRSDDVQTDLGGVYLAMGQSDDAMTHLDRALELNSQNVMALQNKAVLMVHRGDIAAAGDLNRRVLELDPQSAAGLRLRDRLAAAPGSTGG